MNILIICSRNKWRSPTGEHVLKGIAGLSVRSAGTSPRANHTVSIRDIQWADIIFTMEQCHKDRLKARFCRHLRFKIIHVLDIPDDYQYRDPELIDLIRVSTEPYI